ncbi:MAG TPA: hypothetical protein VG123_26975 [Streptosporangiaceae bacterium]|jgi:hypothetical protein|nr:hypothetical protein [Streptosporangiaceae bacterium]
MQYALLIYAKPGAAEALGADEQEAGCPPRPGGSSSRPGWPSASSPTWASRPACMADRAS